jgi:GTP-binding protein
MVPANSDSIKKEYKILLNELKKYNPELLDKRRILAISKCDLLEEKELKALAKKLPTDAPTIMISSHTEKNLMELKDLIWKTINKE